MASQIRFKLEHRLGSILSTLPDDVAKRVIKPALLAGARIVKNEVVFAAPWDRGGLASSIHVRELHPRLQRIQNRAGWRVVAPKDYASFLEWGWKHKKEGSPFFRETAFSQAGKVRQAVTTAAATKVRSLQIAAGK